MLLLLLASSVLAADPSPEPAPESPGAQSEPSEPASEGSPESEPAPTEAATAPTSELAAPHADPAKAPVSVLRSYKQGRLVRGHLTTMGATAVPIASSGQAVTMYATVPYSTQSWTIYDGGGAALTPLSFAATVGDEVRLAEIEQIKRRGTALGWGMLAGGVVMSAGGIVGMALQDSTAGVVASASFLFGGAVVAPLSLIPITRAGSTVRASSMPRYYEPSAADEWTASYNDALRAELGLSEEDVREIELGP